MRTEAPQRATTGNGLEAAKHQARGTPRVGSGFAAAAAAAGAPVGVAGGAARLQGAAAGNSAGQWRRCVNGYRSRA